MTAYFDTTRTFGIEIEIAHVGRDEIIREVRAAGIDISYRGYTHMYTDGWKVVTDSSVSSGYEVVSPILSGHEGLSEVHTVMAALRRTSGTVNVTTGLHVHHFVGDLTGEQIAKAVALYAKFEPVIDFLVAPSRRHAEYARKLNGGELVKALPYFTKYNTGIYHHYDRVSVQPVSSRGTMEFRQHQGTLSGEKATAWIVFTQQFVNKAASGSNVSLDHHRLELDSQKATWNQMAKTFRMLPHMHHDPVVAKMFKFMQARFRHFKGSNGQNRDNEM